MIVAASFVSMLQLQSQCIQNNVLSNQTVSGPIEVSISVSISGTVTAIAAVFSAPTINLNAGFCVPGGTTFETDQSGCTVNNLEDGTCAAPYILTCGRTLNDTTAGGEFRSNSGNRSTFIA